jgi:Ni,Fe-hydrogenase III large subunit
MTARSGFRERTIRVGVLDRDEALNLGVTGLVARASGIPRDSRLGHPIGAYLDAGNILRQAQAQGLGDDEEAAAGDVFARTLVRAREVLVSYELIAWLAKRWLLQGMADSGLLMVEPRIFPENNYTSAIGYAEGCRGDVVYWLMQDKMNGIYRCKARDPSMLNWPALSTCAQPRELADGFRTETLVADFPLLNKSFSLSYAGNDL